MALVTWSEGLSVSVQEMDKQHQELIRLINQLHEAMKNGKGKDEIGKVLTGLIRYTKIHFAAEEKLMQEAHYPGYQQQKSAHEALVKQVLDLQTRFNANETLKPAEVITFLSNWLVNHIKGEDKKYAPFLTKNQKSPVNA